MVFKRHALLIGYSGPDIHRTLQGVPKDLERYKKYLMSTKGGSWYDKEITILYNTDINSINKTIEKIKNQKNDFVFFVYSGHGYYNDDEDCRYIGINRTEKLSEKRFSRLGESYQISIFDSCSEEPEIVNEAIQQPFEVTSEEDLENISSTRFRYEKKIKECITQRLKFYAAKKGDSAFDTNFGACYSQKLIDILMAATTEMDIVKAHDIATEEVIKETNNNQHPEKVLPPFVSFELEYLPGVVIV